MAETTAEDRELNVSEDWAPWRARIAAAKRRRDDKIGTWQENVSKRVKSPESLLTSDAEVSVNQDWPKTKAKIANLYSQTPEVRLTPRVGMEMFAPAVQPFARELNDTLETASVGSTIEEVLCDVVNAAGIGAVLVTCEKRTEPRLVPKMDPMLMMPGAVPEFELVDALADIQYLIMRISPADLLVPSDFTGSNYDHARWLGHQGRMTWAQATRELGLGEDVKDKVLSRDVRGHGTQNTLNSDANKFRDTEVVNYTEIFHWAHYTDPEETNFKALKRLVFVDGLDEPVVADEPYKAQERGPQGMMGVVKNPIRVCTLTYVSDESLPPSDSSIARFTVDELEESRNDMRLQRKHSVPIRWYNPNLVSPGARAKIEQGRVQDFISINGMGDRAIGEVSRAAFPPEKFEFDRIAKAEIAELWQVGDNQSSAFASGDKTASEANIVEKNFQRRVGQEQDKVQKFFIGIAEVLAGHLALYGTFDLPDELGPMRQAMANAFTYSVRVDSTVRLDAEQRIQQLTNALNLTAQSGYVNPKQIISEIWELSGVDPARVVVDPQPKPPEPVKVSVSKAEDLINPLFVACLMRTGQAPGPDDVAAAIKLLQQAALGGVPLIPPSPSPDGPQGEVAHPGITNADWQEAPRINKRDEDGGA